MTWDEIELQSPAVIHVAFDMKGISYNKYESKWDLLDRIRQEKARAERISIWVMNGGGGNKKQERV